MPRAGARPSTISNLERQPLPRQRAIVGEAGLCLRL